MWDPPRPGLEPVSPALAGRFSTTAPPGKPRAHAFGDRVAREPSLVWTERGPRLWGCGLCLRSADSAAGPGPPGSGPLARTETLLLAARAQTDAPQAWHLGAPGGASMERLQVSAHVTHPGVDAETPPPPDFSWWFTQPSGRLGPGLVFPGALRTPPIMDSGAGAPPPPLLGPSARACLGSQTTC